MKKVALLLASCMLLSVLSGCTLEIPSISEAKSVVKAYAYYNLTGELSPDIIKILESNLDDDNGELDGEFQKITKKTPIKVLEKALKAPKKSDMISLAKQYYEMTYPNIEGDTKTEYTRLVTWKPDFRGKRPTEEEIELQKNSSINVALALSYTDAKNFYLAMAASVFSLNPDDPTAANNFAAATASYGDDLELGGSTAPAVTKYYEDAQTIYQYALLLTKEKGEFTQAALPILVSAGNLYLDNKKFGEAYACFQVALEMNSEYYAAIEGLYNTYMAMNQYKLAMELLAKMTKYPVFVSANKKTQQQYEEDQKEIQKASEAGDPMDEQLYEKICDIENTVEAVSVVDFIVDIDEEAREELNNLIRQVQNKMTFDPPEITLISQYSSLQAISKPIGRSALQAFSEGLYHLDEEIEERKAKTEPGEMSDTEIDEFTRSANEYRQNGDADTLRSMYEALSATSPEYSVFTLNEYEYTNPIDIAIQRQNISALVHKINSYSCYLYLKSEKIQKEVDVIVNDYFEKHDALYNEMDRQLDNIGEDDAGIKMHRVHTAYYPRLNNIREVAWNQATQAAVTAYKQKIIKYSKQMYNDCMKHIILISDDKIGQMLEERLRFYLLSGLLQSYHAVYYAFSFTIYDELGCGCDTEAMYAKQEARRREEEKLANDQIRKNMEAKKNFEMGVLDENTKYYKKYITPYEVKMNTPFVQGVIGPYKSNFKIKIDLPGKPSLEFSKMEHHIRNTTTYNGAIEYGIPKGPAKVYIKASATADANGNVALDDVDVISGAKVTLKKSIVSADIGIEASAVRGTRVYSSLSLDGGNKINSDIKKGMGSWTPKLKKVLWEGQYQMR